MGHFSADGRFISPDALHGRSRHAALPRVQLISQPVVVLIPNRASVIKKDGETVQFIAFIQANLLSRSSISAAFVQGLTNARPEFCIAIAQFMRFYLLATGAEQNNAGTSSGPSIFFT